MFAIFAQLELEYIECVTRRREKLTVLYSTILWLVLFLQMPGEAFMYALPQRERTSSS